VFRDGATTVLSSLPLRGVVQAIDNGGTSKWVGNPQHGWPQYAVAEQGGLATISIRPADGQELDQTWRCVRELDDRDADVLLAMTAHYLAHRDARGYARFSASTFLDDRGLAPKRGAGLRRSGHRPDDLADVARRIDHLGAMWVTVRSMIIKADTTSLSRRHRRGRFLWERERPLLQIEEVDRLSQAGLGSTATPVRIVYSFRLGAWAEPFLAAPNRQVARLMQHVLRYHPLREQWEKRLGRYFTFHLRISHSTGPRLTRRVGSLIEELRLSIDDRNPHRSLKRFERALERLTADGVIGGWHPTTPYVAATSGKPCFQGPHLRGRNWLGSWLHETITVWPPPTSSTL
jgi:hypothetical protein